MEKSEISNLTLIALGNKLRRLRHKKGKSLLIASIYSEVNKTYLSDLENGRRNPSLKVLCKLAKYYGVSLSELLEGIPLQ
jgi:transcriptional regulator with XRE-family HTH domain